MANSPLAQFFTSNNFNNAPRPAAGNETKSPKNKSAQKISVPPGFSNNNKAPQLLLASNNNNIKETKLITPTMFAPSSNSSEKKPSTAEPLTKNQLLQALNYLIENDDDFTKKIHEAYISSFKSSLS